MCPNSGLWERSNHPHVRGSFLVNVSSSQNLLCKRMQAAASADMLAPSAEPGPDLEPEKEQAKPCRAQGEPAEEPQEPRACPLALEASSRVARALASAASRPTGGTRGRARAGRAPRLAASAATRAAGRAWRWCVCSRRRGAHAGGPNEGHHGGPWGGVWEWAASAPAGGNEGI